MNGNITSSLLFDVAVTGSEILCPAQDYSPVASFNGGTTWGQPGPYGEGGAAVINPGNTSDQYLLTTGGFFFSSDGGTSFAEVLPAGEYSGSAADNAIAVDPSAPSTVYVAGTSGIWKSTNWGASFALQSSWPGASGNPATLVAVSPASSSDLFVGTTSGLYVSSNGGSTWTPATGLPVGGPDPNAIAVDPANPSVVLVMVASPAIAIYRSTDSGTAFSPTTPLTQHPTPDWSPAIADAVAFEPGASPPVAAAAGPAIGILLSTDGGASWASAQGNAVTQMFTGLAFSGGNLYASTLGEGILKTTAPS